MGWLAEGVLSSLLAILLAVASGNFIYWIVGRRKIQHFFNLGRAGVVVYTANLTIKQFGSTGVDGRERSYAGPAVPEADLKAAVAIEEFMARMHPRLHQVSGPLASLRFQWSDVQVKVDLSPADARDAVEDTATLITIGSPAYNSVSGLVEAAFVGHGQFVDETSAIRVESLGPFVGTDYAMIQRRVHPVTGQRAFYVAGSSAAGTQGAALYLLREWSTLRERHGDDRPFTVVVKLPSGNQAATQVVCEWPTQRT